MFCLTRVPCSWVFSSALSAGAQKGHSVYDPSKSPTSHRLRGESWKVTYGDGSGALGNVYTDTVQIGSTTATNQAVGTANLISEKFQQDTENDGLLGLAFDVINQVTPHQQKTFFSNVKNDLANTVFTADLKKGKPGSFDFGFIDSTKYTGKVTYVPVDSGRGFWEFDSNGYAIGNNAFTTTTINAIMDTGTSLILLPPVIVSAYYSKISSAKYDSAQGGYTFPCSAGLSSITLGFGSYKAMVPGSFVNYSPLSSDSSSTYYSETQRKYTQVYLY